MELSTIKILLGPEVQSSGTSSEADFKNIIFYQILKTWNLVNEKFEFPLEASSFRVEFKFYSLLLTFMVEDRLHALLEPDVLKGSYSLLQRKLFVNREQAVLIALGIGDRS